jgi:spermidine synthase
MKSVGDRFTKSSLGFAFLLMGFSFTVMQTLMARELLVSFAGNELSIGLVLGSWLILEAVGSGLAARLAERVKAGAASYAALQVALSLLLPLSVYAAFTVRRIVGITPGEGMGLVPTFYSAFLVLLPLGLIDGAMFTFGCRAYAREISSIGHVYVLEAIGGIIGGLVFTYLFIPYLHSVQVILILAALNLASAVSLLVPSPKSQVTRSRISLGLVLVFLAASLYLLLSPQANTIRRWFVGQQWRGYNLVYYGNSIYGNVAAIQQGEQYTFFANGVPILTAPVPDITSVEELVHLPMLFVPQPRRVLVVSGGVGGVLNEILKYPVERVDYAELDPLLIEVVQRFPTELTTRELSDPRVHIENVDGRLLVRELAAEGDRLERYDLVIVNLPYPLTLQLNRFYTVEFFRLVREILTEEGVVALPSPGTLTYMSPGMRNLNATIYETLRQVFPHTHVIPGDVNLWLASPEAPLEAVSLDTLVQRWEERALPTSLMTDFHVRLRLDERWLTWFWDSMQKGKAVEVNQDLRPSGLLYGLFYWNELFSPGFSGYFEFLERMNFPLLGGILIGLTLVLVVVRKLSRWVKIDRWSLVVGHWSLSSVPIVIVITGFAGMAFDLLVIFAFQAFYGYVYQRIGLLVTAFMAGLSLGGWLMTRRMERIEEGKPLLLRLEGAIVACWLLFPVALTILYAQAGRPGVSTAVGPILLTLNVLAGFLVGMEFPLASKMYRRVSLSETAGILYASDLLGAFLGSLLVSVMFLPALGVLETCLLMGILKLGSLLLVATMPRSQ